MTKKTRRQDCPSCESAALINLDFKKDFYDFRCTKCKRLFDDVPDNIEEYLDNSEDYVSLGDRKYKEL